MNVRKLARSVGDAWEVPRDLLLGRYPPFVTGGALPHGDVPVFVFHSLEPLSFERKLKHLADNGYATLGADEHFNVLMGARPAPERAVVLTFDDGRASLDAVGRPLLRKYGMKGVVFLVPGRTPERGATAGPEGLLGWDQVETLSRDGIYEFQSHTQHHARIATGARIERFLQPRDQHGYDAFDVPLVRDDARDLLAPDAPLGTPILESAPRTSEAWRFIEDPQAGARCALLVGSDPSFFDRPGWEDRLRAAAGAVTGRTETEGERSEHIRRELADARTAIEARTGRPVTHLCYPWHASGPTSQKLAKAAGYRTAYQGKVAGVPITRAGGNPRQIARLGEDYVELLPGRGRQTIGRILRQKWRRRFGRQQV